MSFSEFFSEDDFQTPPDFSSIEIQRRTPKLLVFIERIDAFKFKYHFIEKINKAHWINNSTYQSNSGLLYCVNGFSYELDKARTIWEELIQEGWEYKESI